MFKKFPFLDLCFTQWGLALYISVSAGLSACWSIDSSLAFLHEVRGQQSKKSDTAGILKKNLNPGIKGY